MIAAQIPYFILLLAFGAASAACSAAETALFSLTAADRLRLRRTHPGAAAVVAGLLANPRRLLVGLLFLNTLAIVGYTVVSSELGTRIASGLAAPESTGARAVIDLAFRLLSMIVVVLCAEMLPKIFAATHAVRFAALLGPVLAQSLKIAGPVVTTIESFIIGPLSRLIRPPGSAPAAPLGRDELSALLTTGASAGHIDEDEQDVLARVVELGELRVRDVMAPRVDIRWVPETAGEAEVIRAVRESGHTKFPVCRGSLDGGVIGLLNAKTFLQTCAGSSPPLPPTARVFAQPVLFVPERARLDRLLESFRDKRTHVAMCVDEYGQITGIVEIEDVVKRLMAADTDAASGLVHSVRSIDESAWLAPGRLGVRHWADLFGPDQWRRAAGQHESRVSTLGGLVFSRLGRLPRVGDSVSVGNVRLAVETMDGRSVGTVRVSLDDGPGGAT